MESGREAFVEQWIEALYGTYDGDMGGFGPLRIGYRRAWRRGIPPNSTRCEYGYRSLKCPSGACAYSWKMPMEQTTTIKAYQMRQTNATASTTIGVSCYKEANMRGVESFQCLLTEKARSQKEVKMSARLGKAEIIQNQTSRLTTKSTVTILSMLP
jgi:hypothetical protein